MDTIYLELLEKKEIRSNLSALRAKLREGVDAAYDREIVETFVQEHEAFILGTSTPLWKIPVSHHPPELL